MATATKTKPAEKAEKAPRQRKAKELHGCNCFSARTGDSTDEGEPIFRACGQTTTGRFAPGHDAKLKSVLMELAVNGQEYHRMDGGILVSGDPNAMARDLAWDKFVDKAITSAAERAEVQAARTARKEARAAEREELATLRAAEKAAAKEAKAAQQASQKSAAKGKGKPARAKVGRSVKDVEIVAENGDEITVRYETSGGNRTTGVIKRTALVTD